VTFDDLIDYMQTRSSAWERQAYLRGRSVAGEPDHVRLALGPALSRGISQSEMAELNDIRRKLFKIGGAQEIDLKLEMGGLADIEFQTQIAILKLGINPTEKGLATSTHSMIQYLMGANPSWKSIGDELSSLYDQLRIVEQRYQLIQNSAGSKIRIQSESFARLSQNSLRCSSVLVHHAYATFSSLQSAQLLRLSSLMKLMQWGAFVAPG
jgi:glutamate-ammonia-ligase adenylyltransferase